MRDPPLFSRRLPRPHLDSATCRSFIRLLSHCVSHANSLETSNRITTEEVSADTGDEVEVGGSRLDQEDELGLLEIQKKFRDCAFEVPVPVSVSVSPPSEELFGSAAVQTLVLGENLDEEHVVGQEEHVGTAILACHDEPLLEGHEQDNKKSDGKSRLVMAEAELTCPVDMCDDHNQQVKTSDVELFDSTVPTPVLGENPDEHLVGKEEHVGTATAACQDEVLLEGQKRENEKSDGKSHLVMAEAELTCQVDMCDDQNQQLKTTCMEPVIPGSGKPDERIVTNNSNVPNGNAEMEEGEILGGFEDEIVVQDVRDTLTTNEMDNTNGGLHQSDSFTMKEDYVAQHDFSSKNKATICDIVDYSDLYQTDQTSHGNKLAGLAKKKKVSSSRKKNGQDELLFAYPKSGKGNSKSKEIECNISPPDKSVLSTGVLEEISLPNVPKEFNSEGVESSEKIKKKKKGPLTEERKAKKKQAKKRKRAEQNRKLGIKRLKILPVSMPKKVIYCDFYLQGRCQKGDLCKFSHDTTPLTKSQPCKYFACQSCLKGSDCPFDHELWKYPCHNFVSKGTCSRGGECKFSHQIVGESTGKLDTLKLSQTPDSGKKLKTNELWKYPCHNFVTKGTCSRGGECKFSHQIVGGSIESTGKLDTLKLSQTPDSGTKLNSNVLSSLHVNGKTTTNINFSIPSSEQRYSEEQAARRTQMKVPIGIRFLSLGEHPSEDANSLKFSSPTSVSEKKTNISSSLMPIKNSPTNTLNPELKLPVKQQSGNTNVSFPEGIRFLSFGEDNADMIKNQNDKMITRIDSVETKSLKDQALSSQRINEFPSSSSGPASSSRSIKGDTTSIKGDTTSIKGDTTSIKGDTADATKILDEFLFCDETNFRQSETQPPKDQELSRQKSNEFPSRLSGSESFSRSNKGDTAEATKILEEFLFCGDT